MTKTKNEETVAETPAKAVKEPVVRVTQESGTTFYSIHIDDVTVDGKFSTYHEVEKELIRRGLPTKITKLEMVKD